MKLYNPYLHCYNSSIPKTVGTQISPTEELKNLELRTNSKAPRGVFFLV